MEATALAKGLAKLSVNYDEIPEVEKLFPSSASLFFINGHGGLSKIKDLTVTLDADGYKYLYWYEQGKMYDISYCYNANSDEFIMNYDTHSYPFCSYILSDTPIINK